MANTPTNPRFERILDLERAARTTQALGGMIVGDSAAILKRDRNALYEALNELTPEEARAFGEYRKIH